MQTLRVRVIALAKRNEIAGERNGRILIRTVAQPIAGKANKAVIELLSAHLKVAKSKLTISKGLTSRDKTVQVND